VLAIFADALLRPDFPDDQIEIVRGQVLSGLRQARQDTRSEADQALREMLYPPGHPYRERVSGDEETVAAVDRAALVDFHERTYAPSAAIVAVAGGITHADAVALVERHLGSWTGATPSAPPVAVPDVAHAARVDRELPGKVQADLALGVPAIARDHPDYYTLSTANLILGRLGLMGRLGESVRERQGMAYYAYSALETGLYGGFWSARAGVNPDNIERTIESVREEVRGFLIDGPTAQEFADAVGNLTGSLPLGLETGDSIARVVADIAFFNLGADYLRRYRAIIRALTPKQLTDALRRHVDPEQLAVAVARPASD
jgi:zinc protease